MKKKKIVFGIPCYNEEENVSKAHLVLETTMQKLKYKYDWEYIFVDNHSEDNTRKEIEKLCKKHSNVSGIFLSRNFGPESSGQAALDFARGDAFMFYECDMQDPPEKIPEFIQKWEEGFDVVVGIRTKIEEHFFMKWLRITFYKILKQIAHIEIPVNAGSFALLDKHVVQAINNLPEKHRFHRGLRAWVGFNTAYILYERRKRQFGKVSYTMYGYFHHAERSLFGFSYLPLDMMILFSFLLVLVSFIFLIVYLGIHIMFHTFINGNHIIIACIIFFSGIQLTAISLIGKYIQVILEETKNRPMYIVEKIIGKKIQRLSSTMKI